MRHCPRAGPRTTCRRPSMIRRSTSRPPTRTRSCRPTTSRATNGMAWSYTEPRVRRRPLDTPVRPASGGGGGAPSGPAGGDLAGTYPNPTLAPNAVGTADIGDAQVTDAKIASVSYAKLTGAPAIPTTLPPSGPAGGDLAGSYPNPTLKAGAVNDVDVTDVGWAKITGAPASFPPSGAASGDLTGTYPGPTVAAGK